MACRKEIKNWPGDFNGDGIGDVGIRRDNEFGLWWLITFQAMAPDVNQQFGISDKDLLVAGDIEWRRAGRYSVL